MAKHFPNYVNNANGQVTSTAAKNSVTEKNDPVKVNKSRRRPLTKLEQKQAPNYGALGISGLLLSLLGFFLPLYLYNGQLVSFFSDSIYNYVLILMMIGTGVLLFFRLDTYTVWPNLFNTIYVGFLYLQVVTTRNYYSDLFTARDIFEGNDEAFDALVAKGLPEIKLGFYIFGAGIVMLYINSILQAKKRKQFINLYYTGSKRSETYQTIYQPKFKFKKKK